MLYQVTEAVAAAKMRARGPTLSQQREHILASPPEHPASGDGAPVGG